ncbi:MAG: hypothetical protein HY286_08995 [Planctomycetes bacterium]|nr:hypothetical protein [Planctomycetota bacterium]
MSSRTLLLLGLTLLLPSCALGRGPAGIPVTFVVEDRPTGLEFHEAIPASLTLSSGFAEAHDRRVVAEARELAMFCAKPASATREIAIVAAPR